MGERKRLQELEERVAELEFELKLSKIKHDSTTALMVAEHRAEMDRVKKANDLDCRLAAHKETRDLEGRLAKAEAEVGSDRRSTEALEKQLDSQRSIIQELASALSLRKRVIVGNNEVMLTELD